MALRDKIVMRLDGSVPAAERTLTVEVRSPGGEVTMDTVGEMVEIAEVTRGGRVKDWQRAHRDHIVYARFIAAK